MGIRQIVMFVDSQEVALFCRFLPEGLVHRLIPHAFLKLDPLVQFGKSLLLRLAEDIGAAIGRSLRIFFQLFDEQAVVLNAASLPPLPTGIHRQIQYLAAVGRKPLDFGTHVPHLVEILVFQGLFSSHPRIGVKPEQAHNEVDFFGRAGGEELLERAHLAPAAKAEIVEHKLGVF